MTITPSRRPTASFALALLALATLASAGPLNPPAGPVLPTAKPLAEVEPRIAINDANTPGDDDSTFRITQPGSYYLTENLRGERSKHGIEIASSDVVLDLRGFQILGSTTNPLNGIEVSASDVSGLTIRNGTIRNWSNGIDFGTSLTGALLEAVHIHANSGSGVNGGDGVILNRCTAAFNGIGGFVTGRGSAYSDCVAFENTVAGFNPFGRTSLTNCSAYLNGASGFSTGDNCTLTNCSAVTNGASGFSVGDANTLVHCAARFNGAAGISSGVGCMIRDCVAQFNEANGIMLGGSSAAIDCVASFNTGNGLIASSDCLIRGNHCDSNGFGSDGAGILVSSGDNRIEGNNSSDNDRGIDVDSAGNIIIRNTCAGNAVNWDIVANNVFGPIVNRTTPMSSAVVGDSAASTLATTDANANFTY